MKDENSLSTTSYPVSKEDFDRTKRILNIAYVVNAEGRNFMIDELS